MLPGYRAAVAKSPPDAAVSAEPVATPKSREEIFAERLDAAIDLPAAIDLSRGYFADAFNDPDPAGVKFALWATRHMTWPALQAVEETKRSLVLKDSAVERGYRVCTSGSVVEIRVVRAGDVAYSHALLQNAAYDITHVLAVGSTRGLVEKSSARFCGLVVGRYTYENSGGGMSHAITLVGMFDLPENKLPRP
jgi:hypothetical protein